MHCWLQERMQSNATRSKYKRTHKDKIQIDNHTKWKMELHDKRIWVSAAVTQTKQARQTKGLQLHVHACAVGVGT